MGKVYVSLKSFYLRSIASVPVMCGSRGMELQIFRNKGHPVIWVGVVRLSARLVRVVSITGRWFEERFVW